MLPGGAGAIWRGPKLQMADADDVRLTDVPARE